MAGVVGGWVSFTCTIQSKSKLTLALMTSEETVVGVVLSTTYAAVRANFKVYSLWDVSERIQMILWDLVFSFNMTKRANP